MNLYKNLKLFDTFGRIAIASLFVCGLTGFFLILPYDPVDAYLSVTTFVTANTAASLTRNLHYWSAQLFLVFTILHFIDHFKTTISIKTSQEAKKGKISHGLWIRLVLSLIVIFYVMLSGFILKDDADSRQAHLLLSALLASVPIIGDFLSSSLAGKSGLIVIYLHHAATATIIIFIVIFQHVRDIKVRWLTFVYTSIFLLILSLLLRAPLSLPDETVMKGPWYFIGIQELLHQFTDPLLVVCSLFIILIIIYLVPFVREKTSFILRKAVWVFALLYLVLTIIGYFFRGPFYEFQIPFTSDYETPKTFNLKPISVFSASSNELEETDDQLAIVKVNGRVEGCMSCHKGMKGLSVSHDPNIIGCYSCHGGDPFTLNADAAHKGMYKVPGNLSNSKATCGNSGCHENIVERLPNSMMASLSGMIAVDKWVFGESKTPNGSYHVKDISNSTSDVHLKNLCAGCHLGMEKTEHGNAGWLERGGGCNACHLTYTDEDLVSLKRIKEMKNTMTINRSSSANYSELQKLSHPKIDLNITNDKCESCHSRSGRISMSYAGWHETDLQELPSSKTQHKKLPDGRIFTQLPADVHHEAGMLCIDCHGSYELMGDGKKYNHKEEAVKIACEDCHISADKLRTKQLADTDRESQLIAWVRGWSANANILITKKSNTPIVNAWYNIEEDKAVMVSKTSGKVHQLKSPLPQCVSDNAHKRLSCETCHTAWVPQCIGCHNAYEKETMGYDMLKRKPRKGTWVEFSGEAMAELPTLGMKNTNEASETQQVGIFSPGMIMTIDNSGTSTFHRLFAPVSGHTTQRISRSCKSCHLNPLALGFGRGTLELSGTGTWSFSPLYAINKHDHLPEDSWTWFLQERNDQSATRLNMRPLNVTEQKRILKAGACLTCHDEKSAIIQDCLIDFDKTISNASSKCIIPK